VEQCRLNVNEVLLRDELIIRQPCLLPARLQRLYRAEALFMDISSLEAAHHTAINTLLSQIVEMFENQIPLDSKRKFKTTSAPHV